MGQPVAVLQGRKRPGLGRAVHPEMVAHLPEGCDQIRCADGIANPRARQTMGLGKGPHPDQTRVIGDKIGGGALGGAIDIGLVQHQQTALRQCL